MIFRESRISLVVRDRLFLGRWFPVGYRSGLKNE